MFKKLYILTAAIMLGTICASDAIAADPLTILNVSYDPTREFYDAYNHIFTKYWKDKTGQDVNITQSHGGSGTQARSVIEGLHADVVTLALAQDIDEIAKRGLLDTNWQSKFPNNSCPYNSIIVFLVYKGNPKHIKDWDDLTRDDVQIVTPNPKTSGGARWNYLAAWGYAYKKNQGNEEKAREFISKLYKRAPVLDAGARGATINFTKRGLGDVLVTWESEALLITHKPEGQQFEIATPSMSILAEPPVAVVEKNAVQDGTEKLSQEYLEHLYSKDAQELMAKFYYRPSDKDVLAKNSALFPIIPLVSVNDFGGWKQITEKHFSDGGIFDQIYSK